MELYKNGTLPYPQTVESVNNHIHTTYSFSPYSPTKAVYMAFCAGLKTAGIMDHDSIAGAKEFIKAGEIAGISTTVGLEVRVKMNGSKFFDRRYN
ncbi:MAG: PHP domain-containing protein, partial [Oscillospiraceae bacterium]|nr:PHP domain-containing protein [Candidatus Equicaccousia limihippi]